MRFMITAAPDPNRANPPERIDDALFAAYMKFNEDMAKAGVLVVSEGLNPAAKGARVGVKGGKRTVLDGPFTESKELVGGFYLIDVDSLDEAISWALRCPTGFGSDDVLTIHPMTGEADIPPRYMEIIRQVAPTGIASTEKKR